MKIFLMHVVTYLKHMCQYFDRISFIGCREVKVFSITNQIYNNAIGKEKDFANVLVKITLNAKKSHTNKKDGLIQAKLNFNLMVRY